MRLCRERKGLPYPLGVLLSKSLSFSLNHFCSHRNPAGTGMTPQNSFFMKRGVFSPMFSTTGTPD